MEWCLKVSSALRAGWGLVDYALGDIFVMILVIEELLERSQKLKVFGFKIIFFTVQKLLQIDYVRLNIQYLLE